MTAYNTLILLCTALHGFVCKLLKSICTALLHGLHGFYRKSLKIRRTALHGLHKTLPHTPYATRPPAGGGACVAGGRRKVDESGRSFTDTWQPCPAGCGYVMAASVWRRVGQCGCPNCAGGAVS